MFVLSYTVPNVLVLMLVDDDDQVYRVHVKGVCQLCWSSHNLCTCRLVLMLNLNFRTCLSFADGTNFERYIL